MKKQLLTTLAATAVLGATTVFAANPFSDVTPNDWAYQAVEQLAADGIINGYPNGTFQGQKDITRFEVAQMTAKAMAYQGKINAEQQALINRLANEYSSELNHLGVRVSNLEDRVGNVKVTGDARVRYQQYSRGGYIDNTNPGKRSKFDFRGRIKFNANVNKNTKAVVGLTSNNQEFGNTTGTNNAKIYLAYLQHQFGKNVTGIVGRYSPTIGAGLVDEGYFDGAQLAVGNDIVKFTTAYGYFVSAGVYNGNWKANTNNSFYSFGNQSQAKNPSFTLLQLDTNLLNKKLQLGGFYLHVNKGKNALGNFYASAPNSGLDKNAQLKGIYGYNATVNLNRWSLSGEFTRNNLASSNAWVAGLSYGNLDAQKSGTYNILMQYFYEGKNAFVADTNWNQPWTANYKGWEATVDYTVMKNTNLELSYAFNNKYVDKKAAGVSGGKLPNWFYSSLSFKF